jgi:hypothetical protein
VNYFEALAEQLAIEEGREYAGEIPLEVSNLRAAHGSDDVLEATWTYMCDGSMTASEAIEWCGKRYSGLHADLGAWAEATYGEKVGRELDSEAFGFLPRRLVVDWADWAEGVDGDGLVEVIVTDSGLHVFDKTND